MFRAQQCLRLPRDGMTRSTGSALLHRGKPRLHSITSPALHRSEKVAQIS
jgi:hypothetical protein